MADTTTFLGICAIVVGSNATVVALCMKIFFKVGENARDIKFIKQLLGMNNNKKEELEWNGKL